MNKHQKLLIKSTCNNLRKSNSCDCIITPFGYKIKFLYKEEVFKNNKSRYEQFYRVQGLDSNEVFVCRVVSWYNNEKLHIRTFLMGVIK